MLHYITVMFTESEEDPDTAVIVGLESCAHATIVASDILRLAADIVDESKDAAFAELLTGDDSGD